MRDSALMVLGSDSAYTSAEARDLQRTQQVRLAALVCSGVSVVACLIASHWFCRMEKLFRHRLIMLLIYGDLTRNTWYFVFTAYSTARGVVKTESKLCQASGFFIQYGEETSDYAVLAIAVHSALQVFRPARRGNSDGLYKYRHYLFAGGLLVPVAMASLAFVNSGAAYLSLGAFCTLPIRPFWYRLALAWIPRYLIAAIIISLAIAIYAYVGFEFRSYANLSQNIQTPTTNTTIKTSLDRDAEAGVDNGKSTEKPPNNDLRAWSVAHDVVAPQRPKSAVDFASEKQNVSLTSTVPNSRTRSLPGSSIQLPLKSTLSIRPPLVVIPSGHSVRPEPEPSLTSLQVGPLSPTFQHFNNPFSEDAAKTEDPTTLEAPTGSPVMRQLQRQRLRIYRQLRLMFVYPLAYTFMWLIPFIHHCMMYNDHFANRPIWFLRMSASIFITSMGFVDCLIFSMREKPWRHINNGDGTFWGSLRIWRSPRSTSSTAPLTANMSVEECVAMDDSRVSRIRTSVRTSGSDDITRIAVEQARVRLDMEREERMKRILGKLEKKKRKASVGNGSECDTL